MTKEEIKKEVIKLVYKLTKNMDSGEGYERGETYMTYKDEEVYNFFRSPQDMMKKGSITSGTGNQLLVEDVLKFVEELLSNNTE